MVRHQADARRPHRRGGREGLARPARPRKTIAEATGEALASSGLHRLRSRERSLDACWCVRVPANPQVRIRPYPAVSGRIPQAYCSGH